MNIFLRQIIRVKGIPFELKLNIINETATVIEESRQNDNDKSK
ncbi:MAG: type II toxin-antitoxin system RelB/DinJ family antitoxin [Eubacteriales bacterium]